MLSIVASEPGAHKVGPIQFDGQLCLVGPSQIALANATRLTCGEVLMSSTAPVAVDLDFATGRGVAICERDTVLTLPCAEEGDVVVNGEVVAPPRGNGRVTLSLPRGRHVFDLPALKPGAEALVKAKAALAEVAALALVAKEPNAAAQPPATRWQWAKAKGAINALAVGRLEANGPAYVVAASADGHVYALTNTGKKAWSFAANSPVNDVLVADLDADGNAEIVAACDNTRVYCLDPLGKKLWEFSNKGFEIKRQLPGEYGTGRYVAGDGEFIVVRAADLDGDGKLEVLAGSNTFKHGARRVFGTLFALSREGQVLWHTYQSGGNPSSLDLADMDGDGRPEIALATGGPTYARSNYLLTPQGEMIHRYRNPYGPERIRFVRPGANAAPMIVTADERSGVVSAFDAVEPFGRKWTFPTGAFRVAALVAVDLDGDGAQEAVVVTLDGDVYAFRIGDGRVLWRATVAAPLSAACLVPGASPRIVVGASDGTLARVSATGAVAMLGSVGAGVRSLCVGDLDGDAAAAVVVGTDRAQVLVLGELRGGTGR